MVGGLNIGWGQMSPYPQIKVQVTSTNSHCRGRTVSSLLSLFSVSLNEYLRVGGGVDASPDTDAGSEVKEVGVGG